MVLDCNLVKIVLAKLQSSTPQWGNERSPLMDVLNRLDRLGLTEKTAREDFFTGSSLESHAAEQAATLVLLLSSEKGRLGEIPLIELQMRLKTLHDRGVKITLDSLVEGIQELVPCGFLSMREEAFKLFIKPTDLLLDAIENPHHQ